jgi:RNA polymerase sigma-70 factor (ECF subfamily)
MASQTTTRAHAFDQELVQHMDTLYSAALRLTRNPADARDLQQDALVRALRFHDRYKPGTYLRAWLLTILRNTFINDYRKKARRPREIEFADMEPAPYEQSDRDMLFFPRELSSEYMLEFLGDETRSAVEALPENHRRAVVMADLHNMTYQEIADALNCPIGTVMSRLHRGRRLLRDSLPVGARELAAS